MRLKKLVQILFVTCGICALGACSSKHKGYTPGSEAAVSSGAEATGIGEGEHFGKEEGVQQRHTKKNTYYFDYDSNVIHEGDKPEIYANANYLLTHSNAKIIVEGHTDPRGSREYNIALGERRANAVADLLKSKGVNPAQIRVVSYGAERVAVPGRSEQDYQLDRRAIIVYQQR